MFGVVKAEVKDEKRKNRVVGEVGRRIYNMQISAIAIHKKITNFSRFH